jgi:hypothetical protein
MRGCRFTGKQNSSGSRKHEIVVAKIPIDSFHLGLKDRVEPLCDDLETLFSVQATHIGLCTSLGRSPS